MASPPSTQCGTTSTQPATDTKTTSFLGVAVRDVARLREVAGVVVRHGFGEFVLRMPFAASLLGRELVSRKDTFQGTAPERFAHLLGELGPTYIKLEIGRAPCRERV